MDFQFYSFYIVDTGIKRCFKVEKGHFVSEGIFISS